MQAWMYPHALGLAPKGTIKKPITLSFCTRQVLITVLAGQYYWGGSWRTAPLSYPSPLSPKEFAITIC